MPEYNLTHNFFRIVNIYGDILKIIEENQLTYGDYDCLKDLLNRGIDGSTKERSKKHKDLAFFADEALDLNDFDFIKYDNIIPDGKYPIYDKDDYVIANEFDIGYERNKEVYLKKLELIRQGKL